MRRSLIYFLIGGLVILSAGVALADLSFSQMQIGRSNYYIAEVGATVTVKVVYTNATGAPVNIDAAKLYLDYQSTIIEQPSVSVGNPNLSNLSVSESNTSTPGSIHFQLRTDPSSGQTPLKVDAGASVTLAKITFHILQNDNLVGTEDPTKFLVFTVNDPLNNVSVVQLGSDITGQRNNPSGNTAFHLDKSFAPVFPGLSSVQNPAGFPGNTLVLDWMANAANSSDKSPNNAETLYLAGNQPFRYNIYRDVNNPPAADKTIPPLDGISLTYNNLNDNTMYYFKVNAQDNCSPAPNEGDSKQILFATPHDYQDPDCTTIKPISDDRQLTVNWQTNDPDKAGYIVLRQTAAKIGDPPPAAPDLGGAGPRSGTIPMDPNANGPDYAASTSIKGWDVVKYTTNGETTLVDKNLDNSKQYFYVAYAFDTVGGIPVQQGRNYTQNPTVVVGVPGAAPTPPTNFRALSNFPSGLTFYWNNPTVINDPKTVLPSYAGTKIVYTTNYADWASLDTSSPEAGNVPLSANELTEQVSWEGLNNVSIYYGKAYAYNSSKLLYSNPVIWAAVPGGLGGVAPAAAQAALTQELTVTLTKKPDGLGVNMVGIPFDGPTYDNLAGKTYSLGTFQDLINAVNAGGAIVTAVAYWDDANQQLLGATYDAGGKLSYGTAGFDAAKIQLLGGKGLYISVSKGITFKLKK